MSRQTRILLFYLAILVFLVASFATVVFALGYRFDTDTWKFVRTGSLRVIANTSASYYLNDKLADKTSFFDESFSRNRILPKQYAIRAEKENYQTWRKTAIVTAGLFTDFPKVVLIPQMFEAETVASDSFEDVVAALASPSAEYLHKVKDRSVRFTSHDIWVTWTTNTSYQPFHTNGEEELIGHFPKAISDVQWYRDHDHVLVHSGEMLYFMEIDTRGGANIFTIENIPGPFYYDRGDNAVFFWDEALLKRIEL